MPIRVPPPKHALATPCDECGSTYHRDTSAMSALCPECAHVLYGYASCAHEPLPSSARCRLCGWDGSRSDYVRKRLAGAENA